MKTDRPKVSVIVAVYMAEAYLDRCMHSLLCQTLKEIEIILVDDGSTDRSGEICDRYAANDTRVKVIHKRNEGVALARQCGVDNMTGEYSIHVDPDDWIEPDMLETMYTKAKSEGLDIVVCGFINEFSDRSEEDPPLRDKNDRTDSIHQLLNLKISPSLSNKLIRSDIYKTTGMHFPPGLSWGEDMVACLLFFHSGATIGFVDRCLYHYDRYSNNLSLSRNLFTTKNFKNFPQIYPELLETFSKLNGTRVLNRLGTMTAHKTFYYADISAKEGIRLFFRHIPMFIHNDEPLHRKINLILSAIGLTPIVKPIYKKLKKWLSK